MISRSVLLNERPVVDCGVLSTIDIDNLNIQSCKNASIQSALNFYSGTPIEDAIRHLSSYLTKSFKHILVDVKLHNLKKNDIPCIPGWHIDGGPDIDSDYVLMTAGSSLTEFYTKQFSMPYSGDVKSFCAKINERIGDNYTFKMRDWQIFKYNNVVPHRGAVAHKDGKRLLIRVMGSNKIIAQPIKDWQPLTVRHGGSGGI